MGSKNWNIYCQLSRQLSLDVTTMVLSCHNNAPSQRSLFITTSVLSCHNKHVGGSDQSFNSIPIAHNKEQGSRPVSTLGLKFILTDFLDTCYGNCRPYYIHIQLYKSKLDIIIVLNHKYMCTCILIWIHLHNYALNQIQNKINLKLTCLTLLTWNVFI